MKPLCTRASFLGALLLVAPSTGLQGGATRFTEIKKLTASDAADLDHFGTSVAISGNTVVVGAMYNDDVPSDSGAAYVFERGLGGPNNWGEIKKLTAGDAAQGDHFGASVAISGDTVAVGAYFDSDVGLMSGSAYVFARDHGGTGNWGEVKKLTASDAAMGDLFGATVAISGSTMVVGAVGNEDVGDSSGTAYVFERDAGGLENWGEVKILTPNSGSSNDDFGQSVSISGDTVVVGASSDNDAGPHAGAAYVFERHHGATDNWGQVSKLVGDDTAYQDGLGHSVAICGGTLVAGAPYNDRVRLNSGSAYMFERDFGGSGKWGEMWRPIASDAASTDEFGISVAISGDTVVVGAHSDDGAGSSSGSAYVFTPSLLKFFIGEEPEER